jgi:hypothetical protein
MKKLIERHTIGDNIKAYNAYQQFGKLIDALELRQLPGETISLLNHEIEQLNAIEVLDSSFLKAIKRSENKIVKYIEKNHKIVPKNHYRKLWMIMGISGFGIPLGVAVGLSLGNMGMIGLGFPIGMAIGIGVGSKMDKKALEEGRQLDLELR